MKYSLPLNRIAKYLVILILITTFIFSLYWLWQRQPRTRQLADQEAVTQEATPEAKNDNRQLTITPADGSVLTSEKIKLKGKLSPVSFILIYTNGFQTVSKTDQSGNFEAEISLAPDLNLVTLATLSQDLKENDQKYLTFWLAQSTDEGNAVFAGTVKSIFDTLVTIATESGDKSIRTGKSTKFDIPASPDSTQGGPKEENEETTIASIKNIRVGDFAVALGTLQDQDTIIAKSLEIIRENKPQNTEEFIIGKTITNVKNNLFSAKNNKDGKIAEFTLNKDSDISVDGQDAKVIDVTKDKTAIVFYHTDADRNIVDLIYLLP